MQVIWIGWCSDPIDNHDKVWGIALLTKGNFYENTREPNRPNRYVTFWGRRGKKLQQKDVDLYDFQAQTLINSKEKKGYIRVPEDQINEVYDRFAKDLFKVALKA
jgi:hypothetical protein